MRQSIKDYQQSPYSNQTVTQLQASTAAKVPMKKKLRAYSQLHQEQGSTTTVTDKQDKEVNGTGGEQQRQIQKEENKTTTKLMHLLKSPNDNSKRIMFKNQQRSNSKIVSDTELNLPKLINQTFNEDHNNNNNNNNTNQINQNNVSSNQEEVFTSSVYGGNQSKSQNKIVKQTKQQQQLEQIYLVKANKRNVDRESTTQSKLTGGNISSSTQQQQNTTNPSKMPQIYKLPGSSSNKHKKIHQIDTNSLEMEHQDFESFTQKSFVFNQQNSNTNNNTSNNHQYNNYIHSNNHNGGGTIKTLNDKAQQDLGGGGIISGKQVIKTQL